MVWFGLAYGTARVAFAIAIDAENALLENHQKLISHFLGGQQPGAAFDQGLPTIMLALVLGVLYEISRREQSQPET